MVPRVFKEGFQEIYTTSSDEETESNSSSNYSSDTDTTTDEVSDHEGGRWINNWPGEGIVLPTQCSSYTKHRSDRVITRRASANPDKTQENRPDDAGSKLRRAGEYGQQLLQLLDKESRKAKILSELLEREQRRNAELIEKHTNLMRLRRRASSQQESLKSLEEHSQQLENSLQNIKAALERERRIREDREAEVKKLKTTLDRFEELELAKGCLETQGKKLSANADHDIEKRPKNNQLDTTPSPQKPVPIENCQNHAKNSQSPKKQEVHSGKGQSSTESDTGRSLYELTLERLRDEFTEVKKMYEDERERRQHLQQSISNIMEDAVLQKESKITLPTNRDLQTDLRVQKNNRRATIGGTTQKISNTPPSCYTKKVLKRKKTRTNLESSFNSFETGNSSNPRYNINCEANSWTRLDVAVEITKELDYAVYLVKVWSNKRKTCRIVETRYSKFNQILDWIRQHVKGGLLTLPTKIPRPSLVDSSSTSRKNMKKRRKWLETTLRNIHYEQSCLLDPLLDYVASLNS